MLVPKYLPTSILGTLSVSYISRSVLFFYFPTFVMIVDEVR